MVLSNSPEWLKREDDVCFEARVAQLDWLAAKMPPAPIVTFPGGLLAKSLFEEARYSFVYAQFLGTIVLGLAYIERTLAAMFYAEGRNDLERANLSVLLEEAKRHHLIGESEFQDLEEARKRRNSYAHFRKPGHEDSLEVRAIHEGEAFYDLIEYDATAVMTAALQILSKGAVS